MEMTALAEGQCPPTAQARLEDLLVFSWSFGDPRRGGRKRRPRLARSAKPRWLWFRARPAREGKWWARWDSNPGPRDSRDPEFPPDVDYLFTLGRAGRVRDARCLSSRALQPSGSLCTFRRCTAGLAQGRHRQRRWGFPEFIPSTPRITPRRHHCDESPAL